MSDARFSDSRDSAISVTSETNHKSVVIIVDGLADNEEPPNKDTSPSIESTEVDHIPVPAQSVDDHDVHSSNSSMARSTTILDVDDGAGRAVKETANKTYKKLRENAFLGIVIAIVCGVILTPIILYYTRPDISNPFDMGTLQNNCEVYTSPACGMIENSQLAHFENQNSADSNLFAIFNITSVTQDCQNDAMAFFCNATYRSCVDVTLWSSTEDCETLRNGTCSSHWTQLQNISNLSDCSLHKPPTGRNCPDQFRSDGITCIPLCSEFSQNSEGATIVVNVVTGVISNLANFIGGIIIFVIAFFRRKTMFKFPQILVLYSTTTVSITVIVATIGYFGADVLCSDDNLLVSIANPTAYCEVYGFIYQAGILIFSGFWLLFITHLFLKLVFPIQFKRFESSKYHTKAHILEIVIVLLVGILIPAIVVGTVEYNIVNFPPTECSANVEVTFYTLILPTIIVQGTGMMLILFSFISIHRRKGIFKRSKTKRGCIEFTTPEVKLLLIFLYFTLVLLFYWADFSTSLRNRNSLFRAIFDYISCVNDLNYQEGSCEGIRQDIFDASFPALRVMAILMTSLVNISNVVFVLQFRDVKNRIRTLTRRFTSRNELDGSNHDASTAAAAAAAARANASKEQLKETQL